MTPSPAQQAALDDLTQQLAALMLQQGLRLATAESCTGGWIAQQATSLAGSSDWFEAGLVTYSNAAKQQLLGVDPALIERQGAVSEAVVCAMVQGAQQHTGAQVAVAVSGIAGPSGGSQHKPVGTVWLAWGLEQRIEAQCFQFQGDRRSVRWRSLYEGIKGLVDRLGRPEPG